MDVNGDAPLVAIVTPVYNGAPWLERTLACVQRQSYPNLVHIVRDNASTDETPEMIARARNGRTPIITERRAVICDQTTNWNEAMALVPADARYVKLLPADDLMRADCIARMTALAESDPEIDVVQAYGAFGDHTAPIGVASHERVLPGSVFAVRYFEGWAEAINSQHVFFRNRPGLTNAPFDPKMFPNIDLDFLFRELVARKIGTIPEPLLFTRLNDQTVSAQIGAHRFAPRAASELGIVVRYSGSWLEPAARARLVDHMARKVRRHLIFWRWVKRDAAVAGKLEDALHDNGLTCSAADLAAAALSLPLHKVRRLALRRAALAREPRVKIGEESFLGNPDPGDPDRGDQDRGEQNRPPHGSVVAT